MSALWTLCSPYLRLLTFEGVSSTTTTIDQDQISITGLRRVEDARFLTGQGEYLGDIDRQNLRHVAFLRSPLAHARITGIDATGALALPGVEAVFTGPELAEITNAFNHHLESIPTLRQIEWNVLPIEKVRYAGEPVAAVVATSRYIAEDATELIDINYEELDPVTDVETALTENSPLIYEDWPDNVFLFMPGAHGDADTAFAKADGVLKERFAHHRQSGLPMEGHGALGEFDRVAARLTLHASTQSPHLLRSTLAEVTGLAESKVRVIAPDMGGGFGVKNHVMREEALVAVIAMLVDYPVVWEQDRFESLAASFHCREQIHDLELAYRNDGRVLGLRARVIADIGSPEVYVLGCAPAVVTPGVIPNHYDIQDYSFELQCVVTNKCPIAGYRGFGQTQGIFSIERLMDMLAEKLAMDPVEVRRINLIADEPRPYVAAAGALIDSGSFSEQLDELLDVVDYAELRRDQEIARGEGRFVGVGIAQMVEATAPNMHGLAGQFGGYEMALLTVFPDGRVTVHVGTKSQGQGHETIYAKIVAETLGVPPEHVDVFDGDTAVVPFGMGTWGSRSAVMGGGAVLKAATQVLDKMRTIAASMLNTAPENIEVAGEMFTFGEAAIPFVQIANVAYLHTFVLPPGMDPGLSAVVGYDPGNTSPFPDEQGKMSVGATYASAAAAAVVEVFPNTGRVIVQDLTIVHDCGRIIDPVILDGQVRGAIAQTIGSMFFEEIEYDANGQPLTTTLLDYTIPGFGDVVSPRIIHQERMSSLLGGYRGAGEGPIIVGPAVLGNAVHDAIRPLGVAVRQTNLGPRRLREILRDGGHEVDPLAGFD